MTARDSCHRLIQHTAETRDEAGFFSACRGKAGTILPRLNTGDAARRITAVLTAACFIFSFIAAPAVQAILPPAGQLSAAPSTGFPVPGIPADAGRVTAARLSDSVPPVVLIQDLHCHPEVQKNIFRVLSRLDRDNGIRNIYLEGAYGDVSTRWLAALARTELGKKALDAELDRGWLDGAEYYSIVSGRTEIIKGLENKRVYDENIGRLQCMMEQRTTARPLLDAMKRECAVLRERYFSRANAALARLELRLQNGDISSKAYYSRLLRLADKAFMDMTRYPDVVRFEALLKTSGRISRPRAARDLRKVMGQLRARAPYNEYERLASLAGDNERREEFMALVGETARRHNIDLSSSHPHLARLIAWQAQQALINPQSLIREERLLIYELRRRFAGSPAERDILFISEFTRLTEDILLNRVTADDYAWYEARADEFSNTWPRYSRVSGPASIAGMLALSRDFYAANFERNRYFLDAVMSGMDKAEGRTNAVVTGGFHTDGLARLLKERGIPYIVVTPSITTGTAGSTRLYEELIRAQNTVSGQTIASLAKGLRGPECLGDPIGQMLAIQIWDDNALPEVATRACNKLIADLQKEHTVEGAEFPPTKVSNVTRTDDRSIGFSVAYGKEVSRYIIGYDRTVSPVKDGAALASVADSVVQGKINAAFKGKWTGKLMYAAYTVFGVNWESLLLLPVVGPLVSSALVRNGIGQRVPDQGKYSIILSAGVAGSLLLPVPELKLFCLMATVIFSASQLYSAHADEDRGMKRSGILLLGCFLISAAFWLPLCGYAFGIPIPFAGTVSDPFTGSITGFAASFFTHSLFNAAMLVLKRFGIAPRWTQLASSLEASRKIAEETMDVKGIVDEIRGCMTTDGNNVVFKGAETKALIEKYAGILADRADYPVEGAWPFLKAVVQLARLEEEALMKFVADNFSTHHSALVDALSLMTCNQCGEWIREQSPALDGRKYYFVSAEISHWAGGLGPVMTFHSKGMKELGADIECIEPLYQLRRDKSNPDGDPLDYSSSEHDDRQITFDKENGGVILEGYVRVGGKDVKYQVLRGVRSNNPNDPEAPVHYFIRDADENGESHFTRTLYNYGDNGNASWEEFTSFFNLASAELIQHLEKARKDTDGDAYKPAVVHTNDGQTAPLAAVIKSRFADDPLMMNLVSVFTTHTYFNRRYVGFEYGIGILKDMMHIEPRYFNAFFRDGMIDFTSGGVRLADLPTAVSREHRDNVSHHDPGAHLKAVTNGAVPSMMAKYFREKMREHYPGADVERPTAEQIRGTKILCKEDLNTLLGTIAKREQREIPPIGTNRQLIIAARRCVPEKMGAERAFTRENVEDMVRGEEGQNLIIFGADQGEASRELISRYKQIEEDLKKTRSPEDGVFIFVTSFSSEEKMMLLAAGDVQVQDSDHHTGAAEFSEEDITANGGLQFSPPYHEGVIMDQGLRINYEKPGEGNTIIPRDATPEAYREEFMKLRQLWNKEGNDQKDFYENCALSVRLNRIQNYLLTSAAYLRAVNDMIPAAEGKRERIREEREKDLANLSAILCAIDGIKNNQKLIELLLNTGRTGRNKVNSFYFSHSGESAEGAGIVPFIEKIRDISRREGYGGLIANYLEGHFFNYINVVFGNLGELSLSLCKWLDEIENTKSDSDDQKMHRFVSGLEYLSDQLEARIAELPVAASTSFKISTDSPFYAERSEFASPKSDPCSDLAVTVSHKGNAAVLVVDYRLEIPGMAADDYADIFRQAVNSMGTGLKKSGGYIAVRELRVSPHLFEDHTGNGLIGVNSALKRIEDEKARKIVYMTGIFHEMCHEISGRGDETFEAEQLERDIDYFFKITHEHGIRPLEALQALQDGGDVDCSIFIEACRGRITDMWNEMSHFRHDFQNAIIRLPLLLECYEEVLNFLPAAIEKPPEKQMELLIELSNLLKQINAVSSSAQTGDEWQHKFDTIHAMKQEGRKLMELATQEGIDVLKGTIEKLIVEVEKDDMTGFRGYGEDFNTDIHLAKTILCDVFPELLDFDPNFKAVMAESDLRAFSWVWRAAKSGTQCPVEFVGFYDNDLSIDTGGGEYTCGLIRALLNFVVNGKEIMWEKKKSVKRMQVEAGRKGGYITITIRDNGGGIFIDGNVLEQGVTSHQDRGSNGEGLDIANKTIKRMGGWIEIIRKVQWGENNQYEGAEFTIYLPARSGGPETVDASLNELLAPLHLPDILGKAAAAAVAGQRQKPSVVIIAGRGTELPSIDEKEVSSVFRFIHGPVPETSGKQAGYTIVPEAVPGMPVKPLEITVKQLDDKTWGVYCPAAMETGETIPLMLKAIFGDPYKASLLGFKTGSPDIIIADPKVVPVSRLSDPTVAGNAGIIELKEGATAASIKEYFDAHQKINAAANVMRPFPITAKRITVNGKKADVIVKEIVEDFNRGIDSFVIADGDAGRKDQDFRELVNKVREEGCAANLYFDYTRLYNNPLYQKDISGLFNMGFDGVRIDMLSSGEGEISKIIALAEQIKRKYGNKDLACIAPSGWTTTTMEKLANAGVRTVHTIVVGDADFAAGQLDRPFGEKAWVELRKNGLDSSLDTDTFNEMMLKLLELNCGTVSYDEKLEPVNSEIKEKDAPFIMKVLGARFKRVSEAKNAEEREDEGRELAERLEREDIQGIEGIPELMQAFITVVKPGMADEELPAQAFSEIEKSPLLLAGMRRLDVTGGYNSPEVMGFLHQVLGRMIDTRLTPEGDLVDKEHRAILDWALAQRAVVLGKADVDEFRAMLDDGDNPPATAISGTEESDLISESRVYRRQAVHNSSQREGLIRRLQAYPASLTALNELILLLMKDPRENEFKVEELRSPLQPAIEALLSAA